MNKNGGEGAVLVPSFQLLGLVLNTAGVNAGDHWVIADLIDACAVAISQALRCIAGGARCSPLALASLELFACLRANVRLAHGAVVVSHGPIQST